MSISSAAERRSGTARRWTILLVCVLILNTTLLGLALCGVGAASGAVPSEPESPAEAAETTPPVESSATDEPTRAQESEPTPAAAGTLTVPAEPAVPVSPSGIDVSAFVPTIDLPIAIDEPTEPAPAVQSLELPADTLFVFNPPQTGGEVYLSIDAKVHCLQPGRYLALPVAAERTIEFHRGREQDRAVHHVYAGVFAFRIGDSGWELSDVAADAAGELLLACQPVETGR